MALWRNQKSAPLIRIHHTQSLIAESPISLLTNKLQDKKSNFAHIGSHRRHLFTTNDPGKKWPLPGLHCTRQRKTISLETIIAEQGSRPVTCPCKKSLMAFASGRGGSIDFHFRLPVLARRREERKGRARVAAGPRKSGPERGGGGGLLYRA